jgi:hypothetical protein
LETAAGNFTDMAHRTLFRAIPFETVEFSIIGAFPRSTTRSVRQEVENSQR